MGYPELAVRIYSLSGGFREFGGSVEYYRDVYVLPAALAFLILSAAGIASPASERLRQAAGGLRDQLTANTEEAMKSATLLLLSLAITPVDTDSLASQMLRLGVHDAVVIASGGVDEHPIWSPDGKYVAANVDEKWVRVEVDRLRLEKAAWRGGHSVGLVRSHTAERLVDEAAVRAWQREARSDPRKVKTHSGTTVELRQNDLGTQFVVTRKGAKPEVRWTTELENCHGLALSPDDRYVAFVCEQDGVIIAVP